ncbi:MAG: hypothetical protein ACFE9Q_10670 [Candidatus Hodarchaeota archaeon]
MDPGLIGLIVGIVGSAIGVLGGVIGIYLSIKRTKTTAERKFVIKCTLAAWIAVTLLIILPLLLSLAGLIPQWIYWIASILFYILLISSIFWANKYQATLREQH